MTVTTTRQQTVTTARSAPDGSGLLPISTETVSGEPRTARMAERVVRGLLSRIEHGHLTVLDGAHRATYGDPSSSLRAVVEIRDARAWSAVVREGSIGLGRGFIEGWWHSDEPDRVVRVLIANLGRLDRVRQRLARLRNPIVDPVRRLLPGRGRHGNREDIAAHYDIGNAFFRLFLDETMTYSAGVFADAETSMRDASLAKYDRLLSKLDVGPGHSVLEIGTGWGGFAIRAAADRAAEVTTTTVSHEQFLEATRRVDEAGVGDLVTLLESDWRDLEGSHDRVVSIEMIEAVDWRDYPHYFRTIERCLTPDGLVGIQAICVPGQRFEAAKHTEDFIRRFVFPGGMLPSVDVLLATVARHTSLHVLDVEDLSAHYAETLRRWRSRLDADETSVRALGLDERFCRLWRFYLAYCEAAFTERQVTVVQLVLAGPDWRPHGLGLRPH